MPDHKGRHLPMLKLTKKADYGLIALKHLAEAASRDGGNAAVSAKDIADAYAIPEDHYQGPAAVTDARVAQETRICVFCWRRWTSPPGTASVICMSLC